MSDWFPTLAQGEALWRFVLDRGDYCDITTRMESRECGIFYQSEDGGIVDLPCLAVGEYATGDWVVLDMNGDIRRFHREIVA